MAEELHAPLEARHIPAILEIEKEANSAPWSAKAFENELGNPQSFFRVVLRGEDLIGYGGFWRCIDVAHVTTVAVKESERGKGVGRRLVDCLIRQAQQEGMVGMTLEVRAGNGTAIRLYEELGFVEVGRRRAYYPDNREDAVIMWIYDLGEWRR